jgi:undecaprenyl diphosphate synthase
VLYSLRRGGFVNESKLFDDERDEQTRLELRANESTRESGVDLECVPGHIAVIMDGNRRYGKSKYGNATRGHWDGSKTLIEFTKWCIAEGVQALTVYAFSTENWDRDPSEVSALMSIFCKYCEELRVEALQRGIRIHVLSTDDARIPSDVREGIHRMVSQTKHCDKFTINICLSYGSRGEIVNACKSITQDVIDGLININQIEAKVLQEKMLTKHCCDPDIIIRTSGEERLSNFLLWQSAYSELFFLKKPWPELEKEDLIEVIRGFAQGRKRRYGK